MNRQTQFLVLALAALLPAAGASAASFSSTRPPASTTGSGTFRVARS